MLLMGPYGLFQSYLYLSFHITADIKYILIYIRADMCAHIHIYICGCVLSPPLKSYILNGTPLFYIKIVKILQLTNTGQELTLSPPLRLGLKTPLMG